MKGENLLLGLSYIDRKFIEESEQECPVKKVAVSAGGLNQAQPKQRSARKIWLIAAVIALTLLLVGCAVVYVLHLQDMKIGEEVITQEAWTGPSGEYVPPTQWISSQLSLQGYNGSPEQLALREWLDFKEQYDPDNILLKENNMNESGVPEQYNITYDCYTFEMMDKLNEILDKYHLKPLGTWIYFDRWETSLFYEALRLDSLCRSDADVQGMAGYFSPEGSFHASISPAARIPSITMNRPKSRRSGLLPTPTQKISFFTPIIPLCETLSFGSSGTTPPQTERTSCW